MKDKINGIFMCPDHKRLIIIMCNTRQQDTFIHIDCRKWIGIK